MIEGNSYEAISGMQVIACKIAADYPEADGTIKWNSTTIVIVQVAAGNVSGIGYTYADKATAVLISDLLASVVTGLNAFDIPAAWAAMLHSVRNIGSEGIAAMAISAIDNALWDLKARLLQLPLAELLGKAKESVPVYGSGGFTTYNKARLQRQLEGWVRQGIKMCKIKIGSQPEFDIDRVKDAREAIGVSHALFVDANGAYSRKQALSMAEAFAHYNVSWFEEPVPADDLEGLCLIKSNSPAGMKIAAGEYGYDSGYFRRMLEAGAVDVIQADATRCLGITGFLKAASIAESFNIPISSHCGPAQHLHVCCSVNNFRHMEYFHDHVHIENLLFEGVSKPVNGCLFPDLSRYGNGLELKFADIEPSLIYKYNYNP